MRTTLSLDDDVYAAATAMARLQRSSLGKIVSDAFRRSNQPAKIKISTKSDGLPVFSVSGAKKIHLTNKMIAEMEEEEDIERYKNISAGR